jgi:hypothetical protein
MELLAVVLNMALSLTVIALLLSISVTIRPVRAIVIVIEETGSITSYGCAVVDEFSDKSI